MKNIILSAGILSLIFNLSVAQSSEIENDLFIKGELPSLYLQGETNLSQNGLRLHKNGNSGYIDHRGSGTLYFRVDNGLAQTVRMRIDADGKVGIGGSTAIDALLRVNGTIRVANDSDIFGIDRLVGFNDIRFYHDENLNEATPDMRIGDNGNTGIGAGVNPLGSTSQFSVRSDNSDSHITTFFDSNGDIKFRINSSGRIGAGGNTDPFSTFVVNGKNADLSFFAVVDNNFKETRFSVGDLTTAVRQRLDITGFSEQIGSGTNQHYNQIEIRRPTNNSFYAWHIGLQTQTATATDNDLYFSVTRDGTTTTPAFIQDNEALTQMNFTGQHRSLVEGIDYADPNLNLSDLEGLIVVTDQNKYISMSGGLKIGQEAIMIDESLPVVSLSKKAKDKRVFGVISRLESQDRHDEFGAFVTPHEKELGDQRMYINSTGEGGIWVTDEEGDIEAGDYIVSSTIPGYGMKQDNEFLANYTVAKITMDCNFEPNLIPKQKIKKEKQYKDEQEVEVNVLDKFGRLSWEQECDSDGKPIFETAYKLRYLKADGTQINKSQYEALKLSGEKVYRAAFVGCTYHCG